MSDENHVLPPVVKGDAQDKAKLTPKSSDYLRSLAQALGRLIGARLAAHEAEAANIGGSKTPTGP